MGTELLADMDAIVAQEFDQYFEIELSKAITAALSKGGLQYLATDTVRAENDLTRCCRCWCRHSRSVDYPCGFAIMEHFAQTDPFLQNPHTQRSAVDLGRDWYEIIN